MKGKASEWSFLFLVKLLFPRSVVKICFQLFAIRRLFAQGAFNNTESQDWLL